MYAWFWDHLPGPAAVRALIAVLLLALLIVVCFAWVFPWVAARLPVDNFDQQPTAAAVIGRMP
jgi:hypothetical protein